MYLQVFVVARYLLNASIASTGSPSRRSFVVSSSMFGGALGSDRDEPYLSSCGVIASTPYISLNGANPIVRDSVVFSANNTSGNYSAHLSFLSSFVFEQSLFYSREDFDICSFYDFVGLWMVD